MATEDTDTRKSPGGKMDLRWKKYAIPVSLGLTFVLFLLLRLRYISSIPMWDEARFVYYVRALVSSDPEVLFKEGIYFHPPLYLLTCRFGMGIWGESLELYRAISLVFSSMSFFVLYFLVREVNGRIVALFSCLALALLPAASSTDVWAKEDPLCVFMVLCTLLFFVRRRYLLSGLFLGLSLLSKENSILLLLILPTYLLLMREKKETWRKLGAATVVAAVVCSWWYIFFSGMNSSKLGFFTGSITSLGDWSRPWHFYISGTVIDLGWPLLLLAIWGSVRSIREYLDGGNRQGILPVIVVVECYLVFSLSNGKPFWMITLALPAWAWLAGSGLKAMYDFFAVRGRGLAIFAVAASLVAMLGVNAHTGADRYIPARDYSFYRSSVLSRDIADLINRELPEGSTVVMYVREAIVNPITIFYLRPDIGYVFLTEELDNPEKVSDFLGVWSAKGADAGFFEYDEWGAWLAHIYHHYLGGDLTETPYGYLVVP